MGAFWPSSGGPVAGKSFLRSSIICLNNVVEQDGAYLWPGFPHECRSHHPWQPGSVTITWEPCDCPASRGARGGHIKVACNEPGCTEVWWAPRHQRFGYDWPRMLGHHHPGH